MSIHWALKHPSVWTLGPVLTVGILLVTIFFLRAQRHVARHAFTLCYTNAITSPERCTAQIWRGSSPSGPWLKFRRVEFTNWFSITITNEGEAEFYKVCP